MKRALFFSFLFFPFLIQAQPRLKLRSFSPAMKAYLKGNLKTALFLFQREHLLDRTDPTPLLYMGHIYYDLGQYGSAKMAYEKALKLKPHESEILIALGNTFKKKGNSRGALFFYNQALSQKESDQDALVLSIADVLKAYFDKGLHALRKGRMALGAREMEKVLAWEPLALADYYIGLVLMQSQKLEEAKARFLKAVAQDPNNLHFYIALGRLHLQMGEYAEAIRQFQKVIPSDPAQQKLIPREAFAGLGHAQLEEGKAELKDILPLYLQATRKDPLRTPFHHRWGMIYLRTGIFDEAVFHFQKALEGNSLHTPSFLYLGVALFRKGEQLEAKPVKTTAGGPQITAADLYSSAIAALQRSLQLYPFSSLAHLYLGQAFLKQNKPKHALLSLRKAEAIAPHSADAHVYLGLALSKLNFSLYAIREFQRAIRLQPKMALAHFSLGMAYRQLSMPWEAAEAFLKAHRFSPQNQHILFALSSTYMVIGDTTRARIFLKRALRLEPDYVRSLMEEASELYKQGFLDAAISTYRQVLAADPQNAQAHYALGFVYFVKGDRAKAIAFLERGLKLNSALPVASTARYLVEGVKQKRPI